MFARRIVSRMILQLLLDSYNDLCTSLVTDLPGLAKLLQNLKWLCEHLLVKRSFLDVITWPLRFITTSLYADPKKERCAIRMQHVCQQCANHVSARRRRFDCLVCWAESVLCLCVRACVRECVRVYVFMYVCGWTSLHKSTQFFMWPATCFKFCLTQTRMITDGSRKPPIPYHETNSQSTPKTILNSNDRACCPMEMCATKESHSSICIKQLFGVHAQVSFFLGNRFSLFFFSFEEATRKRNSKSDSS